MARRVHSESEGRDWLEVVASRSLVFRRAAETSLPILINLSLRRSSNPCCHVGKRLSIDENKADDGRDVENKNPEAGALGYSISLQLDLKGIFKPLVDANRTLIIAVMCWRLLAFC